MRLDAAGRPLSVYVHVPYCSSRCGYCDFNTYTAQEFEPGYGRDSWMATAQAELSLARAATDHSSPISSVFFGGGTPTLLPVDQLSRVLAAIREQFGLTADCEVTTEANPDSVTPDSLSALREAGFNRISFGMQSTSSKVLKLLDRTHTPGGALQAVKWAQAAGFEHVSLDLIYGTPGEELSDLRQSLEDAIATGVDHISAYSLTIEPGTRLGLLNSRGEFPSTEQDDLADKYQLVDSVLAEAGYEWYEISNWAQPAGQCRHNLHYWRGDNWWGIGPGAHSHLKGVRFWNEKHPVTWQKAVEADALPWAGSEVLTGEEVALEQVLLGIRLREGLAVEGLDATVVAQLQREGLLDLADSKVVLTQRGRLLADHVVRELTK